MRAVWVCASLKPCWVGSGVGRYGYVDIIGEGREDGSFDVYSSSSSSKSGSELRYAMDEDVVASRCGGWDAIVGEEVTMMSILVLVADPEGLDVDSADSLSFPPFLPSYSRKANGSKSDCRIFLLLEKSSLDDFSCIGADLRGAAVVAEGFHRPLEDDSSASAKSKSSVSSS